MDIQEGLNKTERMLRNGEKPEYVIGHIVTMRENIDSNIRHDDDWKSLKRILISFTMSTSPVWAILFRN